MRILHAEPWCYQDDLLDKLRRVGDLVLTASEDQDEVERLMTSGDFDAVFLRVGLAVSRPILERATSLKHLVTPTTGTEHVDLDAAAELGVSVLSLRRASILVDVHATAEHTLALVLALRRRLLPACRTVTEGTWSRRGLVGTDLRGSVLGVVGYGRLGKKVAAMGSALGMEVLVHDSDPGLAHNLPDWATWVGDLNDMLPRLDVLSLHASLDAQSAGMLSAERFGLLPPGAVVVNTARGELVDEVALLRGLQSERLGGAALDVLSGESRWSSVIPEDHPLRLHAAEHDNLILTPHIGGVSHQAIRTTRSWLVDRFIEETTHDT